jgi:hypothetical protein
MAAVPEKSSYPDGDKYPVTEKTKWHESSVPSPKKPQPQPTQGEV